MEVASLCTPAKGARGRAQLGVRPADGIDRDDPHFEVVRHLLEKEKRDQFKTNPRYLTEIQEDGIVEHTRAVVMDWNIELVEEVGLSNEVLLLSYNFLDRYLSRVSVKKDMLQLVSVACVWLASKICDGPLPSAHFLGKLCGVRDKTLCDMERWIIVGLKWDLHPPTVYHFVHALLPFLCDETGLLAKYAEHVAVAQALCYSLCEYSLSTIAISSLCCATEFTGLPSSDHVSEHLCRIVGVEVQGVAACLVTLKAHIKTNLTGTVGIVPEAPPVVARVDMQSPTCVRSAAAALQGAAPKKPAKAAAPAASTGSAFVPIASQFGEF